MFYLNLIHEPWYRSWERDSDDCIWHISSRYFSLNIIFLDSDWLFEAWNWSFWWFETFLEKFGGITHGLKMPHFGGNFSMGLIFVWLIKFFHFFFFNLNILGLILWLNWNTIIFWFALGTIKHVTYMWHWTLAS